MPYFVELFWEQILLRGHSNYSPQTYLSCLLPTVVTKEARPLTLQLPLQLGAALWPDSRRWGPLWEAVFTSPLSGCRGWDPQDRRLVMLCSVSELCLPECLLCWSGLWLRSWRTRALVWATKRSRGDRGRSKGESMRKEMEFGQSWGTPALDNISGLEIQRRRAHSTPSWMPCESFAAELVPWPSFAAPGFLQAFWQP